MPYELNVSLSVHQTKFLLRRVCYNVSTKQVTSCIAEAVAAKFPEITTEEIEIVRVSNNGLSHSDSMRKVFERSNLDTLDNAFEAQVRKFRESQYKATTLVKTSVDNWKSMKEENKDKATEQRLAVSRFAHNWLMRTRSRLGKRDMHIEPPTPEQRSYDKDVERILATATPINVSELNRDVPSPTFREVIVRVGVCC